MRSVRFTMAALAVMLWMGGGEARGEMPKRYLLPIWYTGKVEPRVTDGKIEVQARLQTSLAGMKNARVWIEPGKGTKLRSASVAALIPSGDRPKATASTTGKFEGNLPAGSKVDLSAVLEVEPGRGEAYVTLAFDYDFPADELLAYLETHAADIYPARERRQLLARTIREKHAGRKSDGITERVELQAAPAAR